MDEFGFSTTAWKVGMTSARKLTMAGVRMPGRVTSAIRNAAQELAGALPRYVAVQSFGYDHSRCHWNALHHARTNGGTYQPGWSIWEDKNFLFFNHHAVWKQPGGHLIDVTPPPLPTKRIMFVTDDGRPYEFLECRGWTNRMYQKKTRLMLPMTPDIERANERFRHRIGEKDVAYMRDRLLALKIGHNAKGETCIY